MRKILDIFRESELMLNALRSSVNRERAKRGLESMRDHSALQDIGNAIDANTRQIRELIDELERYRQKTTEDDVLTRILTYKFDLANTDHDAVRCLEEIVMAILEEREVPQVAIDKLLARRKLREDMNRLEGRCSDTE